MKLRTLFVIPGILAAGLVLAGCSTGPVESTSPQSTTAPSVTEDSNSADVMFAQMMVPHHVQAVEMSDVILAKDGIDPRVITLAEEIKAAQQPEIDALNGMLKSWGMPQASTDGMAMDHGGSMDGMMTEEDMAALDAATGTEASRRFLEQMIVHHEGAVEMAQIEVDSGTNPDAVAMAQAIIDTQNIEIETMREILQSL
ncbi:DUF305 domain-containing protein [Specibacter sp. NPDC078692]|uniref:DUF305 domain-containing protein n=1 Tax=Specibacter sp. NPDC078692 TaxID=3155818 RepID=UPI0034366EBF